MKTLLSLGGASAGIEKFRKLTNSDEDRWANNILTVLKLFCFLILKFEQKKVYQSHHRDD
jgi:hypothetical protein